MIPMKHSTIFKNRWFAVLWAVGIIWFAIDFTSPDETAAPPTNAQVQGAAPTQSNSGNNTQDIKNNTAEVRAMLDELHKQE